MRNELLHRTLLSLLILRCLLVSLRLLMPRMRPRRTVVRIHSMNIAREIAPVDSDQVIAVVECSHRNICVQLVVVNTSEGRREWELLFYNEEW